MAKKQKEMEIPVSSDFKDYSNDPFIVKKRLESEATLKKYGFPKGWQPQKNTKVDVKNNVVIKER